MHIVKITKMEKSILSVVKNVKKILILAGGWKSKLVQPLWKTFWQYLLKLTVCIPCGLSPSLLLGIQPVDMCLLIKDMPENVHSSTIYISENSLQAYICSMYKYTHMHMQSLN